jgi:chromosomal replication initiation ATPase DnaA
MDLYRVSPVAIARHYQQPSMVEIASRVAERHGFTLDDLRAEDRRGPVARVRQEAMAAMYDAGYGKSQIGRVLWRTSWTVHHGVRRARGENWMQARARHE